jgi:archaellum component FlaC
VGKLYTQIKTLTTQANQANEEIKQQTAKLATSASEINRLQKQLTTATEARTRNINNMQMRHAENIRAATAQIQELTKNVQERNAIIQRSKVTGQWKGAAVRGLGTQLKNTRTNLTRAQKEIGVARNAVNGLRGQRKKLQNQLEDTKKILRNTQNNLGQLALAEQRARGQRENLRRRNAASQKVITGLTQQRQNAQRGINQLRATTRNLEQKRLAANRATNKTFNASAAFNRQMKGVAPRQSWQSLKPKATMVGAVQADVLGKRLREKLLKNIDTTNISGELVINGGPLPGSERRALKKEVQNPMTRLNKLRAIEKMIFNRKAARNSKATAEIAQKRMNQTIRLRGSAVNAQPPKFSFGNTPAQARVTRNQLLVQNNRNNAKKYINTFFKGIGLGTKGELKSRINKGENIGAVLRNARYRNSRAGGPAAAARIRGQAFAS